MPRHAKHTKSTRDEAMIKGLRTVGQRLTNIDVGPGLTSPEAIAARYQAHIDAMVDAREKEIAWRLAVERERVLEEEIKELHARVALYLRGAFGAKSAQLRHFGLKQGTAPNIPVHVKLQAIERRRETRKLRGTMGRKQRRRIKGKTD